MVGRKLSSVVPQRAQKYANPFKSGVQLFMQAKELANLDHFSESDPFLRLYLRHSLTAEWKFVGKTETIDNNLNPKWVKHFHIEYQFDKPTYLKFDVFDDDGIDKAQLLGGIEIELAQILTAPQWLYQKSLVCEGKFTGTLIVQADVVNVRDDTITFQIGGDLVSKKWLCWGSDNPYIMIERARTLNETGETLQSFKQRSKVAIGEVVAPLSQVTDWVRIYKSDYRFGNRKPVWDCETFKMTTFCNNNKSLPLKVSVLNYSNAGEHEIYGSCVTSVREIEMGKKELVIQNERGLNNGTIFFRQMSMNLKPSLLAYLKSGWKISCGVSIDFTLSNKPYNNPKSHHWQDAREHKEFAGEMNEYERAIFEIGCCLEQYTFDKKFHLMGFGGQPRYMEDSEENNRNSRCWNLNGMPKSNIANAKVEGTQGMLVNYLKALRGTTMMGPTYFADTFRRFISIIQEESKTNDKIYFVFVILTDGAIHDMKETCKLVVQMSYLPTSIIIVGIGEEDFSQMEILDADTKVLVDDNGTPAARDIIQFVRLNDMNELAKVDVDANILTEVPHHFVDYMILQQIRPMEELDKNPYLETDHELLTDRNLMTDN